MNCSIKSNRQERSNKLGKKFSAKHLHICVEKIFLRPLNGKGVYNHH